VFANLLTNAAKYTPANGQIAVAAAREGGELVVRVRDNGVGIDPEMLPRVFDLFAQERQSIDRSQGGLGLGLAIARSLVALHGGSISAHSDGHGRGAELVVRLPARTATATRATAAGAIGMPAAAGEGRAAAGPQPAVHARVLVVDDNEDAARLLADALEALGYATRVAHDGPSALVVAQAFAPEIALLDIGLPVMDGYELARRLRAQSTSAAGELRLIAVTGYGQAADRGRSKEAGFDEHLVKPVDLGRLQEAIQRLRRSPQD
jgi:CheY-like chemotaxis protein